MTAQPHDTRLSWEDYLRFTQAYAGDELLEYDEGRIVTAMTGGTERHDLMIMALGMTLARDYAGGPGNPCRVFLHNRQIKTRTRSYHPDILVRCGKTAHALYEDDARWIMEVLSPSNSPAEITRMLDEYRALPSIELIVFVDMRRRLVTVHRQLDAGWSESQTSTGVVTLGLTELDFGQLWDRVEAEATSE